LLFESQTAMNLDKNKEGTARKDQKVTDPTLQEHRHNYRNHLLLEVGFIKKHILETSKIPL